MSPFTESTGQPLAPHCGSRTRGGKQGEVKIRFELNGRHRHVIIHVEFKMVRRTQRIGFSLIELIVVIGILSVLMSLLLGAVQRVRAASARLQCQNNIKQLSLALHSHHDAIGSLPPGVTKDAPSEQYPRMSWHTRLLPYIEQMSLWDQTTAAYAATRSPFVSPPHIGLASTVSAFGCPVDPRTRTSQFSRDTRWVALTSYVGVTGTDLFHADGVLYLGSKTRFGDIVDGTSNTIAVGERPPSSDMWYGWWYAGVGQLQTGSGDMLLGVREINTGGYLSWYCPAGPYHFSDGQISDQCDMFHFWSHHSGGANFAFADGSVRFLQYSADAIMPALATRAGGEVVEIP